MLQLKAHAKLNLFLEVVARRIDGYHELASQLVFLDLHDELTFEPADFLSVEGSEIAENIILKTAEKLQNVFGISSGAKITLQKNIPVAAGMGGGSADAAATIVGLQKLWDFEAEEHQLYDIALQLGADVPACLYSILKQKNAVSFAGIGEELIPASAPENAYFVLVNPLKQLPTATVFSKLQQILPPTNSANFIEKRNDLQAPAIAILPEIAAILAQLEQQPNCQLARMTGSGATCFAMFASAAQAQVAAQNLKTTFPNYWVHATSLK